ncbi:MAG: RES family NAD+ phosphorylase [Boseongicola sp.]|nr:RES family NAD+ phosphorylase [Boseongicola sp.]
MAAISGRSIAQRHAGALACRPSRFSDGSFGVCYAGDRIEVALFETMHHHAAFMAATKEAPGWTSDFRELVGVLDAELHDVTDTGRFAAAHDPDGHATFQVLGAMLRAANSNGVLYRSVRFPEGLAVALFWPDVAGIPARGEQFSCYWDGGKVSQVRNLGSGEVFRVVD